MMRCLLRSTLFPYTTLFRSNVFADLRDLGPVVDTEAVIARNPDIIIAVAPPGEGAAMMMSGLRRSEEHTSELQSRGHLVCRLLLEKKKYKPIHALPLREDIL